VQRPGVLETVTIDLYIIRKIGMFMRRFPAVGGLWGALSVHSV
jgi:aarF domain-containing kinase